MPFAALRISLEQLPYLGTASSEVAVASSGASQGIAGDKARRHPVEASGAPLVRAGAPVPGGGRAELLPAPESDGLAGGLLLCPPPNLTGPCSKPSHAQGQREEDYPSMRTAPYNTTRLHIPPLKNYICVIPDLQLKQTAACPPQKKTSQS